MFRPFHRFFRAPASCVATSVELAACRLARIRGFVYSRAVVFRYASPVIVSRSKTILFQASAVRPVVFVNGASTQPAGRHRFRVFRYLGRVVAVTLNVKGFEVLACPRTSVSANTRVLYGLPMGVFASSFFPLLKVCVSDHFLLNGCQRYDRRYRTRGYVFRSWGWGGWLCCVYILIFHLIGFARFASAK